MEQKYIERFRSRKDQLKEKYSEELPRTYTDIVEDAIGLVSDDEYQDPDTDRIECIDHGDYQGTMVYVVAKGGYQPHTHWYIRVSYGSCSGCDALQALRMKNGFNEPVTDEQVDGAVRMALHVIQNMREMDDDGYLDGYL